MSADDLLGSAAVYESRHEEHVVLVEEHVVLVDEHDRVLGVAPKHSVHGATTPLHRGFSLFLFDGARRVLAQRRAAAKVTWPLVWSNSCCGHPALGEPVELAARRRLRDELGLDTVAALCVMLPDYRYRASRDGVEENELCPVLVARLPAGVDLRPDPEEIAELRWVVWEEFLAELTADPSPWSPWCREEIRLLAAAPAFRAWLDTDGAR